MNGRPTRSTRSQGRYAIVGDSSEEEEAQSSDVQEAPQKTTIKLRMPTRSSNGTSVKAENAGGDDYESVSRRHGVNEIRTAEVTYRSRLRGTSTPSSPVVYESPVSARRKSDVETKVKTNDAELGRRRSNRLELADRAASLNAKHVSFERAESKRRTSSRTTRMVSLFSNGSFHH